MKSSKTWSINYSKLNTLESVTTELFYKKKLQTQSYIALCILLNNYLPKCFSLSTISTSSPHNFGTESIDNKTTCIYQDSTIYRTLRLLLTCIRTVIG